MKYHRLAPHYLISLMAASSGLTSKTFHVTLTGRSGTGKSTLVSDVEKVMRNVGANVVNVVSASLASLVAMEKLDVFFGDELNTSPELDSVVRQLISQGHAVITRSTPQGDYREARIEGPTSFIRTSLGERGDEEQNSSRVIILPLEDSPEQTQFFVNAEIERVTKGAETRGDNGIIEAIVHRTLMRDLRSAPVTVHETAWKFSKIATLHRQAPRHLGKVYALATMITRWRYAAADLAGVPMFDSTLIGSESDLLLAIHLLTWSKVDDGTAGVSGDNIEFLRHRFAKVIGRSNRNEVITLDELVRRLNALPPDQSGSFVRANMRRSKRGQLSEFSRGVVERHLKGPVEHGLVIRSTGPIRYQMTSSGWEFARSYRGNVFHWMLCSLRGENSNPANQGDDCNSNSGRANHGDFNDQAATP